MQVTSSASTGVESPTRTGGMAVVDVGFVLLTVAEFAVLVFMLRGTERL